MLIFIAFLLVFGSLFLVVLYYSGFREFLKPNTLEYKAINRTQGKTFNFNDVLFPSGMTKWLIIVFITSCGSVIFILSIGIRFAFPFRGILIFGILGIIAAVLLTKFVELFVIKEIKLTPTGIIFYNNLFVKTHRGYPRFIRYSICLVYETYAAKYILFHWQRELRFTDGVRIYASIQESSCINQYEDIKQELLAHLPNDHLSYISNSNDSNRRVHEFLIKWRNKFTAEP